MICERCRKKEVSVIHRQMHAGSMQVRHICSTCSEVLEATGELADISMALPPFTASMTREDGGCFPFFLPPAGEAPAVGDAVCPLCGMTAEELTVEGRAGCPRCYEVFSSTVRTAAGILHGKATHAGRFPAAVRLRLDRERQLAALREDMRQALASEAYERAATLRDDIHRVETELGGTVASTSYAT